MVGLIGEEVLERSEFVVAGTPIDSGPWRCLDAIGLLMIAQQEDTADLTDEDVVGAA